MIKEHRLIKGNEPGEDIFAGLAYIRLSGGKLDISKPFWYWVLQLKHWEVNDGRKH